jgi:acyl carrier protein
MSMKTRSYGQAVPSRDSVLADVKGLAAEYSEIPPDQIQETHKFIEDLGWDSLDSVEFAMEVEEHFDISVPDELQERAKSVGEVADGVFMLLTTVSG